jgi:hypothetical protein
MGLEAHVLQEGRLGKVCFQDVAGVMHSFPPANKMQQVISVGAQSRVCHATYVFAVQITINPANLATGG